MRCYNAVLCHAHDPSPRQKAMLFVGGLPEHINVDVEIGNPPDLHTAQYLMRAFKCRAAAFLLAPQPCGNRNPSQPQTSSGTCSGVSNAVCDNNRSCPEILSPLTGRAC